jgi:tagaturonate reductase
MKTIKETTQKIKRPIRAIQFGEGNFLRAYIDWQIDIMNETTDFNGSVAVVQPLAKGMVDMINDQDGMFTTILRGIQDGKPVEEFRKITCIDHCVNPYFDFDNYMSLSTIDTVKFIFSNTTEAGITYDASCTLEDKPQSSFPGKVTAFLYNRFKHFNGDSSKGIVFIPCELIEKNGDTLKKYVLQYTNDWKLEDDFINWINTSCDFCNSLVDRIVPGYPRNEVEELTTKLGYKDNLLDTAEIFLLWVIECHNKTYEDILPTKRAGLNVVWTDDMSFYRTRKVRILNGAHTMSVLAAYQYGLDSVEECTKDETVSAFMKDGIFNEIIPSMDGDKEALKDYAQSVFERFANPYIRHLLLSISLNSTSKFKTRDLPSLLGYIEKNKELPKNLVFSLASLISFYNGVEIRDGALIGHRGQEEYTIKDSLNVLETFKELNSKEGNKAHNLAKGILSQSEWWGQDLTLIDGLEKMVEGYLQNIYTNGMQIAIKSVK